MSPLQTIFDESDTIETNLSLTTLTSLIIAAAGIGVFVLCRFGMGVPWESLYKSIAFGALLLLIPETLKRFSPFFIKSGQSLLLFGLLILVTIIGMLGNPPDWIWAVVLLLSAAPLMRTLQIALRSKTKKTIFLMFAILLFGLWLAGSIYNYRDPLFEYRLFSGKTNLDTLFHLAYSNMIRTFGIASTGLDGTPWIISHFGSHWLFAQWSRLLNIDIQDFYLITYPLVVIPVMIKAMMDFTLSLQRLLFPQQEFDLSNCWSFWLVFFGAFIGILQHDIAFQMAAYWNSLLKSESYSIALLFTFLAGSASIKLYNQIKLSEMTLSDKVILIMLVICIPLMIGMAGFSKISFTVLLPLVYGYILFRLELYKNITLCLTTVALTIISLVIYKLTVLPTPSEVHLFHFFSTYAPPVIRLSGFFILNYLSLFLLFGLLSYSYSIKHISDFYRVFLQKKTLLVEIILFLSVISLIPGNILIIKGASAHYFIDLQYWIALCFLMSLSPLLLPCFKQLFLHWEIQSKTIRKALVYISVLFIFGNFISNFIYGAFNVYRTNHKTRSYLSKHQINLPLLKVLNELKALPLPIKRDMLVYIPKTISSYWNFLPCKTAPLLVPAFTGVAMIQGLPKSDCETDQSYGYGHYELFKQANTYPKDTATLCQRAEFFGFHNILTLNQEKEKLYLQKTTCSVGARPHTLSTR